MPANNTGRLFPCPLCAGPLDVRETKKLKPYVVCDPCGIQMFVRAKTGIDAFNRFVERAGREGLWTRLANLEKRYRLKCPECGRCFWAEPRLIVTGFLGDFLGFQCPGKDCEAVVKWEEAERS